MRIQCAEFHSAPSLTNEVFARGWPQWNGKQEVTLHICGEGPKTIKGGRDRFDTQDFILLAIEFSGNRLAAVPAEVAVRLNQEARRRPGASPLVEF